MDTRALPVDDSMAETGFDEEGSALDHANEVVVALATAWTTYGLYPDPTAQPAFLRTVSLIQDDVPDPIILSVGAGVLTFNDHEVGTGREAVERLTRALFLHDIEFVVVIGNATPAGLVELFRLLAAEPDPVDPHAMAEAALDLDGTGVEIYSRGMLSFGDRSGDGDSTKSASMVSDIASAAFSDASPEELAESIMGVDGDPGEAFVTGFGEVHETVAPKKRQLTLAQMKGQGEDPWKGLRNLVEAFFFLPRPLQITILETVLADPGEEHNRVFLDQLSGIDLAEFLPDLSEPARRAVLDYAVASAGTTDGQPTEVLETLQAAQEVQSARMAMAQRVSTVLMDPGEEMGRSIEEMLDQIRSELLEIPGAEELGREVLRSLLECERRPDRFRRVVRMWTGRIARSIRAGDFEAADLLLNEVLEDPPFGIDREPVVDEGLSRMTTPELLRSFVDFKSDDGFDDPAVRLLRRLAPRVFDQLVERLGETEDAQERRMLTDLLAVSLTDVRRIEAHLNDPRWYVIRNLAIVLGRSGRSAAITPLRRLMSHPEHRVRLEVIRSLVRLTKGDSAALLVEALRDEHSRVRHTALALLKSSESTDVEERIGDYLSDDGLDPEVGKALIALLVERNTPAAIQVVDRIGSRKFAARGSARAVRDAARAAMKRRS